MLFSGKIPFHVAARLTPRFWVPHLLRFATIRHYSRLFAIIRTIRDYSHYSLFAIRDYSLFAIRDYSLFAIRVFQTPFFIRCFTVTDIYQSTDDFLVMSVKPELKLGQHLVDGSIVSVNMGV